MTISLDGWVDVNLVDKCGWMENIGVINMAMQEELAREGNILFKYRSYFPLLFLGFVIWVYISGEIHSAGESESLLSDLSEILGFVFCFLGLGIRIFTVGYSARRTSGRNTKQQVAESLNTTGIYSLVRHPLYLGNYFMWIGIAMFTANLPLIIIFSLIFWLYYERIMYAEEHFLRNKFGDIYLNWAENTPPFFPKFKNYSKPKEHFNLKKVLRKEKDGFFAFILIITFMEFAGEYFAGESFGKDDLGLLIFFCFGLVTYTVLKILKSKKLLND